MAEEIRYLRCSLLPFGEGGELMSKTAKIMFLHLYI